MRKSLILAGTGWNICVPIEAMTEGESTVTVLTRADLPGRRLWGIERRGREGEWLADVNGRGLRTWTTVPENRILFARERDARMLCDLIFRDGTLFTIREVVA